MAHGLAVLTAGATLALILFGGLVTNTGAALAVPDWPTTFGHNLFLYPWSGMVGGVFYEHSHRLIGAVVGLLTLALGVTLWLTRPALRWLAVTALLAVIGQGVLGGLRVVLRADTLAIVHGVAAQGFFALVVTIAFLTSRAARAPAARPLDPSLLALSVLAAGLVYLQIAFGALLTHAGRIDLHLAGAVLVYVFVPIVTARLRKRGDAVLVLASRALLLLLGLQLVLGGGAFLSRFSSLALPGGPLTVLVLPVAHRLVGGLILGAAVVLAVRAALAGAAGSSREPVLALAGTAGAGR